MAAFDKLGFNASRPGRKSGRDRGKDLPDGLAIAELGGDLKGKSLRYSVTLEAKSTRKAGKRVPAGDVGISVVTLHRDRFNADHALVVGPLFSTTRGVEASVAQQIAKDREATTAKEAPRTITLITVDDLARLVRIAPTKKLGLTRLRELFQKCSLPEQCKDWIDALEKLRTKEYGAILLDLRMPQYDGYVVLDFLKQSHPERLRSVLVVSAMRLGLGLLAIVHPLPQRAGGFELRQKFLAAEGLLPSAFVKGGEVFLVFV